jgi:hypothetical protein
LGIAYAITTSWSDLHSGNRRAVAAELASRAILYKALAFLMKLFVYTFCGFFHA